MNTDLTYTIEPLDGGYIFSRHWYDETPEVLNRYKTEKKVFVSLEDIFDLIRKECNA